MSAKEDAKKETAGLPSRYSSRSSRLRGRINKRNGPQPPPVSPGTRHFTLGERMSSSKRRRTGLSRRTFLSAAAATASAGVIGFPAILRGKNLNDKLSLALVGVGGRGGDNLKQMVSENIVAMCDVN